MQRISRHQMFMEIARTVSKRSTCLRLNVGAVVVVDNRVVSIGYCGPAPGDPHCADVGCKAPSGGGCNYSIHAEINAMEYVPQEMRLDLKILYVTNSPCPACVNYLLADADTLMAVFYETPYRDTSSISMLILAGIKVYRITPNGVITDHETNQIVEVK